ncbi:hypothetical protein DZC76_04250 [Pseudomonas sp. phDV1]|nr:hypothetical protein DZC76_04250 [Pseudomonas sp. phDV1]
MSRLAATIWRRLDEHLLYAAYSPPFAARHRFPMKKFRLLHDHLVDSGLSTDAELHRPEQSPAEALTLRLHRLAT